MRNFVNSALITASSILLIACNSGSGGSENNPPPPPPNHNVESLNVEISQSTTDQGNVNWVDLRKAGSHSTFTITFTNNNSIPVGFMSANTSSGGITFSRIFGNKTPPHFTFIDNSQDPNSCINYTLKNCDVSNPYKPVCQNENSMLQPGQSCSLEVFGTWAANTTSSDTFASYMTYYLHTTALDVSGGIASYSFIQPVAVKINPIKLITDPTLLGITKGSYNLSLNGSYAITPTVGTDPNPIITRYNLTYNESNSNGLSYTNPVQVNLSNCYSGANMINFDGTQIITFCTFGNNRYSSLYGINNDILSILNPSLDPMISPIVGSDSSIWGQWITPNGVLDKLDGVSYVSSNLSNTYNMSISSINIDGTILGSFNSGVHESDWYCVNPSNLKTPLTGQSNPAAIYYNHLIIEQNYGGSYLYMPIESKYLLYSDGTISNDPNNTQWAFYKVDINNTCSVNINNYVVAAGSPSEPFYTYMITQNYVVIIGDTDTMVTNISNLFGQ